MSLLAEVTCLSLSNEIKNNPRTSILTEYAEPKQFMMNIFLNCKIFEDDWKSNPELVKSQATEINELKKIVDSLLYTSIVQPPTMQHCPQCSTFF